MGQNVDGQIPRQRKLLATGPALVGRLFGHLQSGIRLPPFPVQLRADHGPETVAVTR